MPLVVLGSEESQVSHNAFPGPGGVVTAFHRPGPCVAQGLAEDGPTGFADGRQLLVRPCLRRALPPWPPPQTVRHQDEVPVLCLALAVTQLTVSPAQRLLALPRKGFRACPTLPLDAHDATDLPAHSVRHQEEAW